MYKGKTLQNVITDECNYRGCKLLVYKNYNTKILEGSKK